MPIYLVSIKIAQEIQINLNRESKERYFIESILSSEQYGFLCLRSIYYVIFTNSKVPPFFPSLIYTNIESYWFPHCPPHLHPTGSTELQTMDTSWRTRSTPQPSLELWHASQSSSCWFLFSLRKSMSLWASSPVERSTKSLGSR